MNPESAARVAVVVTCHAAYLPWLDGALASIDGQANPPLERVVVLDGCEAPPRAPWRMLTGYFGDPSPARDAGLAATTAPWVVFWDADNVMPTGFLPAIEAAIAEAAPEVAIIYPDLRHCDRDLRPTVLRRMPDWHYWALRAENYIDTASAWRREALAVAGSWPRYVASSHEDYALALDVTAAGWQARRLVGPPVLMRNHGSGRDYRSKQNGSAGDDIWRSRTLGIVTLIAPRSATFERWRNFLTAADLPPKTSLYVVDNTGDPAFTDRIYEACRDLQRTRGLRSVDITTAGAAYTPRPGEHGDEEDRNRHVARLYGSVLRRVTEDLVLTLEDDVEPPLDAVRVLGKAFGWVSTDPVGAVAGAYAWPGLESFVCAGSGGQDFGYPVAWDGLPPEPIDVGCVGGGCTMWANWALHDLPVQFRWSRGMGWDAMLCEELRRRGYRIKLHGGVRCAHHVHGHLSGPPIPPPPPPPAAADQLGRVIPPHRATVGEGPWVSDGHRALGATGSPGTHLASPIPGWLLHEDALKLYELAYATSGDVLELGCYQGLSTSILASALAERGREGRLALSVDLQPNAIAAASGNLVAAGLDRWATFWCEDGAVACQRLADEGRRFEFVFVDHSHAYSDVAAACRHMSALVAPGGYCLFHDYNDNRNADATDDEYDVVRAVDDALDPTCFDFLGLHGCCALYRRRG